MNFQRTLFVASLMLALCGCIERTPRPEPPVGQHVYGDAGNEAAGGILALPNDRFLLVGASQYDDEADYDLYLVVIDRAGEEITSLKHGERLKNEMGWKATLCANGDIAVLGTVRTRNVGPSSLQVTLLDPDLHVKWQTENVLANVNSGLSLQGGDFFEVMGGGFIGSFDTEYYPCVVRFDAQGKIVNEDVYNDYKGNPLAHRFCKAADSSFVLFSSVSNYSITQSVVALRYDKYGNYLGTNVIGAIAGGNNVSGAMAKPTGGFALFLAPYGQSNYSMVLLAADFVSAMVIDDIEDGSYYCEISEMSDGKLLLTGYDGFVSYYGGSSLFRYRLTNAIGATRESGSFGGASVQYLRETLTTSDGRALMLGETQNYGKGGTDLFLVFFSE